MTSEQTEPAQQPDPVRVTRRLTDNELCELDLLAAGYLPELQAPMSGDEYAAARSGRSTWPVPVVLAVSADEADAVAGADEVALLDPEGVELATLRCPRADVTADDVVLTGTLQVRHRAQHGPAAHLYLSAEQVRDRFQAAAADPVAIVVTGPPTIAHEAAVREVANRHPVVVFFAASSTTLDDRELAAALAWEVVCAPAEQVTITVLPVGPADSEPRRLLLGVPAARATGCAAIAVPEPGGTSAGHPEMSELAGRHGLGVVPLAVATLDTTPLVSGGAADSLRDRFSNEVWPLVRHGYPPPAAQGVTLFFTGLSGAGKSTIARAVADRLSLLTHRRVTLLDGDVVRHQLSSGLGFSRQDRETNVRRIGWVASEITRHGGFAICVPIAPYAALRAQVRQMVERNGGFVLVHVATPLEECERRDRKGLYAQARRGLIPEFTGISDPYEIPEDAELRIDTTGSSVDAAVRTVVRYLRSTGYIPEDGIDSRGA